MRAVREQNGWQQKELAERIGVPGSQLSRYEAGADQPKIQILVAISEVFQVKLAELVGGGSPDDVIPIRDPTYATASSPSKSSTATTASRQSTCWTRSSRAPGLSRRPAGAASGGR